MPIQDARRSFASALVLSLLCLTPLPLFGKKNPKEVEAAQLEKDRKADEKNLGKYEKLKDFSLNKYQTDQEFRDRVDHEFDELMRRHSLIAFAKNTSRSSRIVSVREDSWRRHEGLYDNLLVQDHINRIGQRLVPPDSERAYAFKVLPDPTPVAETLATGTIYVSTGLISLLETEAQLAYVLAHEMAHVNLEHWKEEIMVREGSKEYAEAQTKKAARIGLVGAIAGAAVGGAIGQSVQAATAGAAAGFAGGLIGGLIANRPLVVKWDRAAEDTADASAFKALLNGSYDVREVPNLYLAMEKAAARDARVGLGFLGSRRRIKQRTEKVKDLIENAYKAEIELQLKKGFLANSAEHRNLMAELKRDNGIMAYYHDMFELARTNLAEAVAIRDNDPAAHYFYGKVLKLVGRNDEDQRLARESFYKATRHDTRQQNFGSHLHLALMLAREKTYDKKQIADEIDTYVTGHARWLAENSVMRAFPPNLDSIYEYMTLYGDTGWRPRVPEVKDLPAYKELNAFFSQETDPRDRVDPSPLAAQPDIRRTGEIPQQSEPPIVKTAAPVLAPVPPLPVRSKKRK